MEWERPDGELPDPGTATDAGEFVSRLRDLRQWAGEPSLRQLRMLARATVDGDGALPVSTMSYVLRDDCLPRMELVRAFVTACLRARGRAEDEIVVQVERWHDSWLRLRSGEPRSSRASGGSAGGSTAPPLALPVPRQLPADVAGFTGRGDELALLGKLLAGHTEAGPVVILAIDGVGGVGKSALAIHAAHQLAPWFPDGQLYVDLHGATDGVAPVDPLDALGGFLRALGVPGSALPDQVDEAAARFRSQLADRRLLVVLDNAADEAQVRPLLPGGPGTGVLVTSRRALPGLPSAGQVHLDVLPEPDAVALLGRLVGVERVAAEPAATAELARRCGHLPLALRIAGARLRARPDWPVAALADRLADAWRLNELELPDTGVRTSFAVSYQELHRGDPAAAGAFALLGLWDGPHVSTPMVARLLDRPEPDTELLLERLVDARLLETPAPGRYRMHDLLRLYARERAAEAYPEPERVTALSRVLHHYAATAWHTLMLVRPGDRRLATADRHWTVGGVAFADTDGALAWLEEERANLRAAAAHAAAQPELAGAATQLAQALFGFFEVRGYLSDWERVNQTALEVARRAGDPAAESCAHNDLGIIRMYHCRHDAALARFRDSLAIRERIGDRHGQATSLNNQSLALGEQGRHDEALACQQQGLAILRELGDRCGEANGLNNLAIAFVRLGRCDEALPCVQRSLALNRARGDRWGEANNLDNLGIIHHTQGRYADALACYQDCLAICRALGAHHDEAEGLRQAAATLAALGRADEARAYRQQALAIYERLQLPDADQLRGLLAEA